MIRPRVAERMRFCVSCGQPRHRGKDGRFVSREPICPYTRTVMYRYIKAMFYEKIEELNEPCRFFGATPDPRRSA